MSKLTAAERNALPDSAFAGPDRSYPVHDANHAANAKSRATQQWEKGNLPYEQMKHIERRANKVLRRKGG